MHCYSLLPPKTEYGEARDCKRSEAERVGGKIVFPPKNLSPPPNPRPIILALLSAANAGLALGICCAIACRPSRRFACFGYRRRVRRTSAAKRLWPWFRECSVGNFERQRFVRPRHRLTAQIFARCGAGKRTAQFLRRHRIAVCSFSNHGRKFRRVNVKPWLCAGAYIPGSNAPSVEPPASTQSLKAPRL